MYLASVTSQEEAELLADSASKAGVSELWIGGQRTGTGSDDFKWDDGNEFGYTNWLANEVSVLYIVPNDVMSNKLFLLAKFLQETRMVYSCWTCTVS